MGATAGASTPLNMLDKIFHTSSQNRSVRVCRPISEPRRNASNTDLNETFIMQYSPLKLLSLLILLSIFASGCAEDSLTGIVEVCQLDADCDDGDACTVDLCDGGLACLNLAASDGDACIGGEPDSICVEGDCIPSECGDGYLDSRPWIGEVCDDGNTVDGDGCAADCTQTAPEVYIDYPARGEQLDGDTAVTVLGRVVDYGVGLESVTVNGVEVELQADGDFEYPLNSTHGLNVVDLRVRSLAGDEASRTHGYYHTSAYGVHPQNETELEQATLDNRMYFRLGQEAFDDYDHPCQTVNGVYVCDEIDDLATVGEIILNGLDVEDLGARATLSNQDLQLIQQNFPVSFPPQDIGGVVITLQGNLQLYGSVNFNSRLEELDFNNLNLRLDARNGGLDSTVVIGPENGQPGFRLGIRSQATVTAQLGFTSIQLSAEIPGFGTIDSADLICLFAPSFAPQFPWDTICPDNSGQYAPLAALDPRPYGAVNSGLSIEAMQLNTGFDIFTTLDGVQVNLVSGNVDFLDSEIDLSLIENLELSLGAINILDGLFIVDLPELQLGAVAQGLDTVLSGVPNLALNQLQSVMEPAISILLLNPLDPLSLGEVVKDFIMAMEHNTPVELPGELLGGTNPDFRFRSKISTLEFSEATTGPASGGVETGFATAIVGVRQNSRVTPGVLLRDSCYGDAPEQRNWDTTIPMESNQHLDLLNQTLHAGFIASRAGLPFQTQTAAGELNATATWYAPMIVSDCGDGLRLEIADFRVSGRATSGEVEGAVTAFVQASLPVKLEFLGETWGFVVDEARTVTVLTDVESGVWANLDSTPVEAIVSEMMVEVVILPFANSIVGSIPSTSIDLASLYALDSGVVLELAPRGVGGSAGFVRISGDAIGNTP